MPPQSPYLTPARYCARRRPLGRIVPLSINPPAARWPGPCTACGPGLRRCRCLLRHMQLDQRAAAGVGLEQPGCPDRRSGRRNSAENPVASPRIECRDLLPAARGVLCDHGVLGVALLVVSGTHEPHRVVADGHPVDVGPGCADVAKQLRRPGSVVKMLDQEVTLVRGIVALADRPHLAATDGYSLEQAVAQASVGDFADLPVLAVPVLDQGSVAVPPVLLADRPHIVWTILCDAKQMVAGGTRVRARHDRPVASVPVLDQGMEHAVTQLLLADGPDVLRRDGRRREKDVPLRAKLWRLADVPGRAIPGLDQAMGLEGLVLSNTHRPG